MSSDTDLNSIQTLRIKGIRKMNELHVRCGYSSQTLFRACAIFDRYMSHKGHWKFPAIKITAFACTCILMAAKFEEHSRLTFGEVIQLLSSNDKIYVSKQLLEELELEILI